ncbi:MAG: NAD(P)-dependent oxidoreductase, partial [Bryobacteraceae bacterium]
EYLDATVGGSSKQVRAGEVIVMAGGSEAAFARARPLIDSFARAAFHLGPWGSGARMKLVLNMVLGLHRAVLAEALSFAETIGVDPSQALDILKASPAYSVVMDVKGQKMLTRNYTPHARLSQHLKDVRLMLSAGVRSGARLPFTGLHEALLEEVMNAGFADVDNSAILEAFLRR